MKLILLFVASFVATTLGSLLYTYDVHATGLKIAPLEYKTDLKKDEKKRGFIDISNPSGATVDVTVSVQGFRQVTDDGGLEFYDDERITRGIKTDLQEFELEPREAVRMYFQVDGRRLPQGDVYGAVFFSTEPQQPSVGVGQAVKVGTLVSLVNESPGERAAVITRLAVPFLQFSDDIEGTYDIKNTGDPNKGFYPEVTLSSWPGGSSVASTGSLLFGGRERRNDFAYSSGIGIHRVDVSYEGSRQSAWVLMLNPAIAIALVIGLLVAVTEFALWRRRKGKRAKRKH